MVTEASEPQMTSEAPFGMLLQMINGFQITQMIYVVAKLSIADLVADEPKTSNELAQSTGSHAPSLYRLLRALASLGIFAEDDQGRFGLTPLAQLLQTKVHGSLRASALFNGDMMSWATWGNLLYSIQTGEVAFDHHFGMSSWEYMAQNPADNAIFNDMFTGFTIMENTAIIKAYDFSGIGTLVDVAGGQGSLIATILKANPTLQGILFDQPHVIPSAQPVLEAAGVAERCKLITGNFFEALPDGGDAYLLKYIVHDWDDDRALTILKNCRRVIKPNGRLLVVDSVIPTDNGPHGGKLMDIAMMAYIGGRERTEAEFRALFAQAGFALMKISPTETQLSVIEAKPI